jgi:hypothetical protein
MVTLKKKRNRSEKRKRKRKNELMKKLPGKGKISLGIIHFLVANLALETSITTHRSFKITQKH